MFQTLEPPLRHHTTPNLPSDPHHDLAAESQAVPRLPNLKQSPLNRLHFRRSKLVFAPWPTWNFVHQVHRMLHPPKDHVQLTHILERPRFTLDETVPLRASSRPFRPSAARPSVRLSVCASRAPWPLPWPGLPATCTHRTCQTKPSYTRSNECSLPRFFPRFRPRTCSARHGTHNPDGSVALPATTLAGLHKLNSWRGPRLARRHPRRAISGHDYQTRHSFLPLANTGC